MMIHITKTIMITTILVMIMFKDNTLDECVITMQIMKSIIIIILIIAVVIIITKQLQLLKEKAGAIRSRVFGIVQKKKATDDRERETERDIDNPQQKHQQCLFSGFYGFRALTATVASAVWSSLHVPVVHEERTTQHLKLNPLWPAWLCVCVSYPISRVLFQSCSVNSRARLPQSLLNTAAIQEHILLSRVAVIITENLEDTHSGREFCRAALNIHTNAPTRLN